MSMLVSIAVHKWIGDQLKSDQVILHLTSDLDFRLYQYDLELEAANKLIELEREFPEDDIVLVGARSVEEVTSAFRNYFNDVREFMRLMLEARAQLLTEKE